MDKSDALTKWIKDSIQGNIDEARKDLSIIMTKADRSSDQRRFNIMKGWVSKWEGPELKAGESSHATERVTITFEEIKAE
jgi:phage tail-like protein